MYILDFFVIYIYCQKVEMAQDDWQKCLTFNWLKINLDGCKRYIKLEAITNWKLRALFES